MLVLSRKVGQAVVIGNNVRVTIVEVAPGNVRVGIDAPSEVSIYREELYEEIAAANQRVMEESAGTVAALDETRVDRKQRRPR